jgi:hypothetical protein
LIGIPVPASKKTDGNRHRGVLPETWVKKRLEKILVLYPAPKQINLISHIRIKSA